MIEELEKKLEENSKNIIENANRIEENLKNIHQNTGALGILKDFKNDSRYERLNNIPRYVGEVAGAYPDNILLITMNGHITCSKYGVIYDSFDCRNRFAEYCWVVK